MSEQKFTERLIPVRMDKPLQDELQRIAEQLGLTKSQVVRASLHLVIEKPSEVQRIIDEWKKESDQWYEQHGKANNNGQK